MDGPTGGATTSRGVTARSDLARLVGGPRGLLDAGLPGIVFVAVNPAAGLRAALVAAMGAGVVLLVLRLARHQTVMQALSGFLAVAVAAAVAARTGQARGFFLPGIVVSAAYGAALLGSILLRWPLAGVVMALLEGRGHDWRADPRERRLADVLTWLWVAVFALRVGVQGTLYVNDRVGWLAVAKLLLGWPVSIVAGAVTVIAVRRWRRTLGGEPTPGAVAPEVRPS